ncbi:MAG: large conductance mechanosensitive channel protein MscL [Bacteroidota bacterium]
MRFKQLIKDFKDFAVKGNMLDIAIGVIIGAAFNKIVDVLVKEIFLPPLSLLTAGTNWENQKIILQKAGESNGKVLEEVAIGYGKLLEATVDFLVIALTVFIVVKAIKKLQERAEDPKDETVKTPKDIELLSEMKELLEAQNELLKGQNR